MGDTKGFATDEKSLGDRGATQRRLASLYYRILADLTAFHAKHPGDLFPADVADAPAAFHIHKALEKGDPPELLEGEVPQDITSRVNAVIAEKLGGDAPMLTEADAKALRELLHESPFELLAPYEPREGALGKSVY